MTCMQLHTSSMTLFAYLATNNSTSNCSVVRLLLMFRVQEDTPCLALQISSAVAAREAIQELCIAAGTCASGQALPSDIQAGVDAVRQSHQARPLPWLGWQTQGRCIVHSQHADVLNGSRTGFLAVAESERYNASWEKMIVFAERLWCWDVQ